MDTCIKIPVSSDNLPASAPRKLGSMKGQTFIASGHKLDDYDDEIVRLFESESDDVSSER